VNNNYLAVTEALTPGREQLVQLAKNSFTASFLDQRARAGWIEQVDEIAGTFAV
jgi:adenosine deaminase